MLNLLNKITFCDELTNKITNMSQSIFEQIGGMDAVKAAVDIFYQKVLSDDSISHFFSNVDMSKQRQKQMAFLAFVFGGPVKYDGKDMRKAHAHLEGLNEDHFNAVAGHLIATLKELNVPQELIDQIVLFLTIQFIISQ